jgi:beta-glucosidase
MLSASFVALVLAAPALGNIITGQPDPAPAGFEEWVSPIVAPAKTVSGDADWASAVSRARAFVSQLTLEEKINVTTGTDIFDRCVGNTGVRLLRAP